ncbi:MAG: putative molybdenum carrier protein [Candidatus Desulfacyla sp.]
MMRLTWPRHCGGWVPKGRKAEDGPVPAKYQLQEMPTASYPKRTEQNVMDSDGTLILSHGKLTGGSALTMKLTKKHNRPCLCIDFLKTNGFQAAQDIHKWITRNKIKVLNVAGARASKDPKIYDATFKAQKAGDGVEGLDIFKERRGEIRFVICDLTMPRMGGWETLAAMRKVRPDIPVILASGYDESTVMKGDHAEWPQAFLGKPYSSKDLRKIIGKVTAGD